MPRRNNHGRRRSKRVRYQSEPEPREVSLNRIAAELVRTGKAPAAILGRVPPTRAGR